MTVQLCLNGVVSLKDKRSIVKSVTSRVKNRFNVSIAEVDHQESRRTALLGITLVANDSRFVNQRLDKVINFMQKDGRFYLGPIERETFS